MGTRTRTTLDSARAKELAANRPAASMVRKVDYRALGRLGGLKRQEKTRQVAPGSPISPGAKGRGGA